MKKELILTVTRADCKWDYFRCPGPGGQHVNKASTGVRCTHEASGAVGQACDHRSQPMNKKLAFERMAKSKEFEQWRRLEVARLTGQLDEIKRKVDHELTHNILIEVKEDGKWVPRTS